MQDEVLKAFIKAEFPYLKDDAVDLAIIIANNCFDLSKKVTNRLTEDKMKSISAQVRALISTAVVA